MPLKKKEKQTNKKVLLQYVERYEILTDLTFVRVMCGVLRGNLWTHEWL